MGGGKGFGISWEGLLMRDGMDVGRGIGIIIMY